MTRGANAVFLSYASEDAEAAQRICDALRAAGIEVWFDKSELRGGDAWDRRIREQIHDCRLFIPIISAHSEGGDEGYFRREWKLAADRTHDMSNKKAFLLPVVIDGTRERGAAVPDQFHDIQWTRLPAGATRPAFVTHVAGLLAQVPTTSAAGEVRTDAPAVAQPPPRQSRRMTIAAIAAATGIVLALGYVGLQRFVLPKRATVAIATSEKSIAVLPFADMSERKDQGYFADGMAEEILDLLAKVPQLMVIGRTSSFQFKGRNDDLRTIGRQLGVRYVVEGSVRRADRRVRVTAQLIDAQSGTHLWSDSYDRDYGDVLTLQDEIATAIARALQLTVTAPDARPLRGEHATEAYTLYLRGKLAFDNFSAGSLLEAQSAFQQALELDPTFLPAAEGLALTYLSRGFNSNDISGRDAWAQARSAADRALKLSSQSAAAHCVLGVVAGIQDFDWATAERELHAALAVSPNDSDILQNAAQIAVAHGDRDEALRQMNAAVVVDPFNQGNHQVRGFVFYLRGDYSAAEAALRKSISIYPGIDASHMRLGFIQLLRGHPDAALTEFAAEPDGDYRAFGQALVGPAAGGDAQSDAALARVIEENASVWPYGNALIFAQRAQPDQAFAWLEKARNERNGDLFFLLDEPLLRPLHDDPRWPALLKSMNLAK